MPRPKFRIRELVFLVLVMALVLGWATERNRAQRALAEAQRMRALVEYERAMSLVQTPVGPVPAPPAAP